MPELPEVETVRRELDERLKGKAVLQKITLLRPDLRDPIPKKLIESVLGEALIQVRRRAKYLLFDFPSGTMISHLGMTGAWRELKVGEKPDPKAHDHVVLDFGRELHLVFRDPRRFGILDFHPGNNIERHKRFKALGPEPMDPALDAGVFWKLIRRGNTAIKTHLMNQKVLVGVGNIYASEALYRSRISPRRKAARVTARQALRLLKEIRGTLNAAILAGGSTIRDYKTMSENEGGFQDQHLVYGKKGLPCPNCHTPIRAAVIGGRNTFWCPQCQH